MMQTENTAAPPRSASRFAMAWARWKRLAHRAAEIQAAVLLSVLYVLLVIPIGFLRRHLAASAIEQQARPTSWLKRTAADDGDRLQDARQQF